MTRPHAIEVSPADEFNKKLVENAHPPDWTNPKPAGRYNLVVVGAGTAGLVAAAGAAILGARVALIERRPLAAFLARREALHVRLVALSLDGRVDPAEADRFLHRLRPRQRAAAGVLFVIAHPHFALGVMVRFEPFAPLGARFRMNDVRGGQQAPTRQRPPWRGSAPRPNSCAASDSR